MNLPGEVSNEDPLASARASVSRWKKTTVVLAMVGVSLATIQPAQAMFGEDAAVVIAFLGGIGKQISQAFFTNLLNSTFGKLSKELTKSYDDNFGQLGALEIKLGTVNPERIEGLLGHVGKSVDDDRVANETQKKIAPLKKTANANAAETRAFIVAREAAIEIEEDEDVVKAVKAEQERLKNPKSPVDPAKGTKTDKTTFPTGGAPVAQHLANIAINKATSNNENHKRSVNKGVFSLSSENSATADEDILLNVFKSATKGGNPLAKTDATDIPEDYVFNDKETQMALANFLTPVNVLTAELPEEYSWLNTDQASVLEDVLMGVSPLPLQSREQLNKTNARSQQLRLFTRFSRLQIARQAVYAAMSPEQHKVRNEEFVAYVARPSDMASAMASEKYQKVMIINLLRGNNLFLMRMREKQLEKNRLLGVMLASVMEANNREAAQAGSVGQASSTMDKTPATK